MMIFNDPTSIFFTQSASTNRTVATLGPIGTSSYAAAEHFCQCCWSEILTFKAGEVMDSDI